MNKAMQKPVDAPLLYDGTDPEDARWDRDERYSDVILLDVRDGGHAKTTAERRGAFWQVSEWKCERLLWWIVSSSRMIPVSVCEKLADISRGSA